MCLYPRLILNRKYTKNKKNGGNIPPVLDERVKYVPVGCQNCIECRKQKARNWQVRLLEDVKYNKNGKFVTLTFSNESIKKIISESEYLQKLEGYQLDNEIATRATRLFLERWRKKYKKSLRHWFVTELGHNGTENIHIHGIVWTDQPLDEIRNHWQYGYIWPRKNSNIKKYYVNERTVNYVTKYITKIDKDHKHYKSIVLTSPGIGKDYINSFNASKNKFNSKDTIETYKTRTGHLIALPIYYRNKLYTETEREKLWLQKLDEDTRWICGEKVKNSEPAKFYKLLEWHRKRNIQLGYGNDEKNWSQEQYELEKRKLLINKRLHNIRT